MVKKILSFLLVFLIIPTLFTWSGGQGETAAAAKVVELEVTFIGPEREAIYEAIWEQYEIENTNVKINLTLVEEEMIPAFETRIAAGDPPDFAQRWGAFDAYNYTNFVNLLEIDYPYWDGFTYDAKAIWEDYYAIKDYVPGIQTWSSPLLAFIFHEDEMEKTGLNPRETVRTLDDFKAFLGKLKTYVDSRPDLSYVLDQGWHAWWGTEFPVMFIQLIGHKTQETDDVFLGKTRWDNEEQNPYADLFKTFKDWHSKGYMPENWPLRDWSGEYEAGFMAKKSIFTFHGPWLFDKTLAQNPSAQLSGFPLPQSHGIIPGGLPLKPDYSSAIFAGHEDKPKFPEIVKAFIWWNSPNTLKQVGEAIGWVPAMDLSEIGGVDLQTPYYRKIVKPTIEGYFGKGKFVAKPYAYGVVEKYRAKGKPMVLAQEYLVQALIDYFADAKSMEDLLEELQARWEEAYNIP